VHSSGNIAISLILFIKPDAETYALPDHHTVRGGLGPGYNIEPIPKMLCIIQVLKFIVYFRTLISEC
jgi:hypothetical protein